MSRILSRLLVLVLLVIAASVLWAGSDEPRWIRLTSAHFPVLTDANEKQGREVVLRMEQMRTVFGQLLLKTKLNMPQPLEIIALKTGEEYVRVAQVRQSRLIAPEGFLLRGDDRTYIVLNLEEPDSWRAVSHSYAHLLMNYNYPPTPPWFDEGFAEYFSSLRLDEKQMQIGGDPTLPKIGPSGKPDSQIQSFTTVLNTTPWLPFPELFTKEYSPGKEEGPTQVDLFHAESWIVMHYLISKNLLAETGSYFDLVQNQKLPVDQAIQKAFGVAPTQFEQNVKDYFRSVGTSQPQLSPPPLGPNDVGISVQQVRESEARALVAELMLRLPEHREAALQELQKLTSAPETESAIAYRALAWGLLQKNDFEQAGETLGQALELDHNDFWTRYDLAFTRYRASQVTGKPMQGLANMMQDLRSVLDRDPDFAEAYNLLGLAEVEGGGINSATASMRAAIQLSPRNERYLLNLAQIYIAAKKWAEASSLLGRLQTSRDPEIARSAQSTLSDLPILEKYGVRPLHSQADSGKGTAAAAAKTPSTKTETAEESENSEEEQPATPAPDTRPIKFLKAKLVSIDCTHDPAAVFTLRVGAKVLHLQTNDYHSLVLIGADQFSCDWRDLPVNVNYKEGKKSLGDVVSLELR